MFTNGTFSVIQGYGHLAVMAFFVLSGYVIAFVSAERETDFSLYISHRMSRIYSVMIVAWLLTAILDSVGPSISATTYSGVVATDSLWIRLVSHVLFLNESWFVSIQYFGNQPLWSLAYEVSYYVLFGVLFLYKGPYRLTIAALIALVVGPVVLLYGLIWLLGVLLYRFHNLHYEPNETLSSVIFLCTLFLMVFFAKWEHLVHFELFTFKKLESSIFIKDFIFAICVFLNIYFFKYSKFSLEYLKPAAKFLSGISFSLYVFHFPLMYFFGALLSENAHFGETQTFLLLTGLITLSVYLLSFLSERQKNTYFKFFSRLFGVQNNGQTP